MDHHAHPADPETMETASLQELLQDLGGDEGGLPAAVRRPLVAAGATVVPALIALVEDALVENHADLGWAPLHAVDLLGALGDARAVPVLLRCLDQEDELDLLSSRRPLRCAHSVLWPSTAVYWRMPPRLGTPSAIGWLG